MGDGSPRRRRDSAEFEPILRALADVPMSAIMRATGMSRGACAAIRSGRQTCHPAPLGGACPSRRHVPTGATTAIEERLIL
jgi:hypothetical protein